MTDTLEIDHAELRRMLLTVTNQHPELLLTAVEVSQALSEFEVQLNQNPLTKTYAEAQQGKGAYYTVTSQGKIEIHKAGRRKKSKVEYEDVPKTGPDETQTHPDIETPPKGFFKTGDALTQPEVVSD
jgi:hypothetical protein